tara:strand:- start:793 stop:1164 length:372 start_codon:yes stop_codon:yes gene_type:complete
MKHSGHRFSLFGIFLAGCLILPSAFAQDRKIANSPLMHVDQVRVTIISTDENQPNQGTLRLVGDCEVCDQTLRFDDGTELVTPFYRGEMDTEVLEEQQFAYAVVRLNRSSGEVLEINYMTAEY